MLKTNLMTAKEVAELLNASDKVVYAMASRHELPSVKISSKMIRFDPEEIQKWLVSKKRHRQLNDQ